MSEDEKTKVRHKAYTFVISFYMKEKGEIAGMEEYSDNIERCMIERFLYDSGRHYTFFYYCDSNEIFLQYDKDGFYENMDVSSMVIGMMERDLGVLDSGNSSENSEEEDAEEEDEEEAISERKMLAEFRTYLKEITNVRLHEKKIIQYITTTNMIMICRLIKDIYGDRVYYSNGFWFYCENGIWKKKKKNEFYELHRKCSNDLPQIFLLLSKNCNFELKCLEKALKREREIEIRYEKGKVKFFRDGNEMKGGIDKDKGLMQYKADYLKYAEARDFHKKLSKDITDPLDFLPKFVKGCCQEFERDDIDEKNYEHSDRICFSNGFINMRSLLETKRVFDSKKIYLFPHSAHKYNMQNTGYKLRVFDSVKKEVIYLRKNIRECFLTDETFKNMLEAKAYCLSGCNPQRLFFMNVGSRGKNGKSLVDDLMRMTLVEKVYYGTAPPNIILEIRNGNFDPERPQPTLHSNLHCRMLSFQEPKKGSVLCGEKIKHYRGGDPIAVRPLYGDPVFKIPHFTGDIAGSNWDIEFDTFDEALKDSIVRIEWNVSFKAKDESEVTETNKIESTIKQDIKHDPKNKIKSAWFYILLNSYNSDFTICEDFKIKNKAKEEETDYIKLFYEECIIKLEDENEKIEGSNQIHILQPRQVWGRARQFYQENDYLLTHRQKEFLEEFDKKIDPGRLFRHLDTPVTVNDKSVKNYYKGYRFSD